MVQYVVHEGLDLHKSLLLGKRLGARDANARLML